ncbi:MAG: MATE family efflux transporter [Myxococcales bacterium]|nr:MAG: MATE family efflux transporter [Myxococcales bacterium]
MKKLIRLAGPLVVTRSTLAVTGIADAVMVSPLGEEAVTSVTAGAVDLINFAMLPLGIVHMVQSFASQYAGKKDIVTSQRYAVYAIGIALLAQVLALAILPLLKPAVALSDYTLEVQSLLVDYLWIRMFGVATLVITEALGMWYAGQGDARTQMVVQLIMTFANIFLNWILITGHWGIPAFGVQGAAIASVLASALGSVLLVMVFFRKNINRGYLSRRELKSEEFYRLLRFGLPNGLLSFLGYGSWTFFINVAVAHLGTQLAAATLIVLNINNLCFLPAFGLGAAGAIIAGQYIGAGMPERAPQILRMTLSVTILWAVLLGATYFLVPEFYLNLFAIGKDANFSLVDVGSNILKISAAVLLFDSTATVLTAFLRAVGDTHWLFAAQLVINWLVFVPLAIIGVMLIDGGYIAAMGAFLFCMFLSSAAYLVRIRSNRWRSIDLLHH